MDMADYGLLQAPKVKLLSEAHTINYGLNTASNFRLFGFATGGYTCKCAYCGTEFIGGKRAGMCLKCAISKAEQLAEQLAIFRHIATQREEE